MIGISYRAAKINAHAAWHMASQAARETRRSEQAQHPIYSLT